MIESALAFNQINGTNPEKGQRLAYNYAKDLGERQNVIGILPSHFPLLYTLKAEDGFAQYCITTEIFESILLRYLYKIVPGI